MRRSIPVSVTAELPAASRGTGDVVRFARAVADVFRMPIGRAGGVLCAVVVSAGLLAPVLAPYDPFLISGPALVPPSLAHPMGTDGLGRDLLSGILYGARTSLLIASLVGVIAFGIGTAVGLLAGYRGGRLDDVLMRMTEFFQVLPRFFFAIIAIALFGPGLDRIVVILGVTSWPVLARVVRAEALTLRTRDFVRAAEAMGASGRTILVSELLPNVLPAAFVVAGLLVGQTLLLEASLGFIGLGDPNAISWGGLAAQAQGFLRVAWWLILFPGLAITLAVLGINLFGDALSASLGGRR